MSFSKFLRNLLLWLIPTVLVWLLITPFYNSFLRAAAQNLVRLTESPDHTRIDAAPPGDQQPNQQVHYVVITRDDLRIKDKRFLYSVRATDLHFPMLFLWALLLAVPDVPWRERWAQLGWATLISVIFHVVLLFFWVKWAYATQLGEWSETHYSSFGQNFWGLGKQILDIPFKFGLPLLVWLLFNAKRILPPREA